MHTNRVSHQRNVIRLHSYIEYFSRNFLLFPSPLHALFYRLQFRWWKFSGKLTRPHASRTSEMWNVNKRARFVNVAQKTKVYVTGWRPAISSLWIAFWKQNAHLARVARSPRLQFLADNREKSANSGPRICPHWGFFFFILIDNYSWFASSLASSYSHMTKEKIRFDDFLSLLFERFCPFSEYMYM